MTMGIHEQAEKAHPPVPEIHFSVDGEHYETTKGNLTPNEIIREFAELVTLPPKNGRHEV